MEGERSPNGDHPHNGYRMELKEKVTKDLKKKHTEKMLWKKRMQIINSDENLEDKLRKEQESLKTFENYLGLIGMLNDSEPGMVMDRNFNINIDHVATVSHILQANATEKFMNLIFQNKNHRALNKYLEEYSNNYNNHDLEKACISVLTIFEICTRGYLFLFREQNELFSAGERYSVHSLPGRLAQERHSVMRGSLQDSRLSIQPREHKIAQRTAL